MNIRNLRHWVDRLAGKRILVVGDVILDEYLIGRASRLSREAPIPVLEFMERRLIPGGAANPAANIAALRSQAIQVGVVGQDAQAEELIRLLAERGIDSSGLVADPSRNTIVKTRILAHQGLSFPQQVARLDRIDRLPINNNVAARILARLDAQGALDAILVSDYLTGLLTGEVVARLREMSKAKNILLTVDAQGELDKYAGFDVVKCNRGEASNALRRDLHTDEDMAAAGEALLQRLKPGKAILITRGADGITLAEANGPITHLRQLAGAQAEVFDTVGAGDTVIAVLTLALAAGAPAPEAAMLANVAAGLVVRRVGNYAPPPDELRWALEAWAED